MSTWLPFEFVLIAFSNFDALATLELGVPRTVLAFDTNSAFCDGKFHHGFWFVPLSIAFSDFFSDVFS